MCFFILHSFISCTQSSSFTLEIPDSVSAPLAESSAQGVRYFSFDDNQGSLLTKYFEENGDAALMLQITPLKVKISESDSQGELSFGFFYDGDNKKQEISNVPVVTDYLQKYNGSSFALSFCFSREKGVPAGFFIKSNSNVRVDYARITRAFIGHDFSGEIPVFAFAPNGGSNNGTDDFRGASLAFDSINSREGLMPKITLRFRDTEGSQKLAFGGEVLFISINSEPVEIP
ncbi:MAG: hypothetical protein IJ727_05925, partial [Treponema sp.]|nr:hypothetical protein [Treponema sp.]